MTSRLIVSMLLVSACAGPAVRPAAQLPPSGAVDGPTAKELVASGAKLVDVRAPDFYGREHIAGAINIPWAQMEARATEIGSPATPVVLYCRTGQGATKAAATLASLGYTHVYNLGSYLNWGEGAPAATPLPVPGPAQTCPPQGAK